MASNLSATKDMLGGLTRAPCPRCGRKVSIFKAIAPRDDWCCTDCEPEPVDEDEDAYRTKLRRRGLEDQVHSINALQLGPGVDRAPFARGKYRYANRAAEILVGARPKGTLVLSGASGLGKTTAAVAAVWNLPGKFVPRERWCGLTGWDPNTEEEMRALIINRGIIVLDEAFVMGLSKPAETQRELEVLFRIVRARHDAGRGTILTTQLSQEDVLKHYHERGEAIVRRANDGFVDDAPVSGGWIRCRE